MRLLVLDGSPVLHSLVRRLAPPGVDVESASTFEEAVGILERSPPQALIVNLGPADLPWRQIETICNGYSPKIPVLFESCVHTCAEEAGLQLNHTGGFLAKPYSLDDLRTQIDRLVGSVRQGHSPQAPSPRPLSDLD